MVTSTCNTYSLALSLATPSCLLARIRRIEISIRPSTIQVRCFTVRRHYLQIFSLWPAHGAWAVKHVVRFNTEMGSITWFTRMLQPQWTGFTWKYDLSFYSICCQNTLQIRHLGWLNWEGYLQIRHGWKTPTTLQYRDLNHVFTARSRGFRKPQGRLTGQATPGRVDTFFILAMGQTWRLRWQAYVGVARHDACDWLYD
jgi:hypothetical protein